MDVVRNFLTRYETKREEELSIEEYLDLCKREPLTYALQAGLYRLFAGEGPWAHGCAVSAPCNGDGRRGREVSRATPP